MCLMSISEKTAVLYDSGIMLALATPVRFSHISFRYTVGSYDFHSHGQLKHWRVETDLYYVLC